MTSRGKLEAGDLVRCVNSKNAEHYGLEEGVEYTLTTSVTIPVGKRKKEHYVGVILGGGIYILEASRFEKVPQEEIDQRVTGTVVQ